MAGGSNGAGAGRQSAAEKVSWEEKSSAGIFRKEHAMLAGLAKQKPMLKGARFQSLGGIYADLEYIPVEGTRYDDGCDRAATTGCKGVSMWVPKGARYPANQGPDDEVDVATLNALSSTEDPELIDLDNPPADHTSEVSEILDTSTPPTGCPGGGCDCLPNDEWLACMM